MLRPTHRGLFPLYPGARIFQPVYLALGIPNFDVQPLLFGCRVRKVRSSLLRLCDVSQGAPVGVLLCCRLGQSRLDVSSFFLQLPTLGHPVVHGALVLLPDAIGFMAGTVCIGSGRGLFALCQPLLGRGQSPLLFGHFLLLYLRDAL